MMMHRSIRKVLVCVWTKCSISLEKHSFWFIYLWRLRFWYGAALGDSAMNMYQVWLCTHLNRQNHTNTHAEPCIRSLVIKFRNELPVWIFRFCYCSPVRVIYNVIVVGRCVVVAEATLATSSSNMPIVFSIRFDYSEKSKTELCFSNANVIRNWVFHCNGRQLPTKMKMTIRRRIVVLHRNEKQWQSQFAHFCVGVKESVC